jgi:uncharacterized membrane protein YdfJ with MMPL/SSD domain
MTSNRYGRPTIPALRKETNTGKFTSEPFGFTQRMAVSSSRRPRRTLAIWGLMALVALVFAGTSLKGLTTTARVVGTTQSSQAEALYDKIVGSASQKPTDVIVVSSKSSTASDQNFKAFVSRLEARVGTSPGITNVVANLDTDNPLVSPNRHAALISLTAATDTDIKPVVHAVESANGSGGFSVAVTGVHTVGNDFTTLSTSDLRNGNWTSACRSPSLSSCSCSERWLRACCRC